MTDHCVLWVGLFMGHLQQLLRSAHPHLSEDIKPPAAQTDRDDHNILRYTNMLLFSTLRLHMDATLHPLVTQQTPDRSSHQSQYSERSPFHDYPRFLCTHTHMHNINTTTC